MKTLETDLQDGLLLVELLDKLATPKSVGRYSRRPINKVQMLENIGKALWFIHEQNIKLVNIGKTKIKYERYDEEGVCELQGATNHLGIEDNMNVTMDTPIL